jgi:hypothetical protein
MPFWACISQAYHDSFTMFLLEPLNQMCTFVYYKSYWIVNIRPEKQC